MGQIFFGRAGGSGDKTFQNRLPKTGQLTSYNTGDDGDLQKGADTPAIRFEEQNISGDDLVIDRHTGLMWPKTVIQDVTEIDWYTAMTRPATVSLGGFDDWRMPNIIELISLLNYENLLPSSPIRVFHDIFTNQKGNAKVWSSTKGPSSQMRMMWMSNGSILSRTGTDEFCGWACCRDL